MNYAANWCWFLGKHGSVSGQFIMTLHADITCFFSCWRKDLERELDETQCP